MTCVFSHNSSPAGITEQILSTSENFKLLENIRQRYKHSDAVQQNATNISLKHSSVESKCFSYNYDKVCTLALQQVGISTILPQSNLDTYTSHI